MYRCTGCGRFFDSLPVIRLGHPYGSSVAYETVTDDMCPACTGDIEEYFEEEEEDKDDGEVLSSGEDGDGYV